jgi:hypothetical protein
VVEWRFLVWLNELKIISLYRYMRVYTKLRLLLPKVWTHHGNFEFLDGFVTSNDLVVLFVLQLGFWTLPHCSPAAVRTGRSRFWNWMVRCHGPRRRDQLPPAPCLPHAWRWPTDGGLNAGLSCFVLRRCCVGWRLSANARPLAPADYQIRDRRLCQEFLRTYSYFSATWVE